MALSTFACAAAPDRPDVQAIAGTTEHIVAGSATQADTEEETAQAAELGSTDLPCEHGTVTECKVWLTEVDCFTGLAVCEDGLLTGCMDENAAEATLAQMIEPLE